jgi:hypothetical protein
MNEPITDKKRMYDLLAAGLLGNTTPQFFSVAEWKASGDDTRYDWWGVRTLTPGGPCRLNCPTAEVEETAERFARNGHMPNISLMLDRVCRVTLWCDVWDSPTGLVVYGIENPPEGGSWRALMPTQGRHWFNLEARMLLKRHLNANSYSDAFELLEMYPDHVLELSSCDRCVGVFPHRNAVHWEVRRY